MIALRGLRENHEVLSLHDVEVVNQLVAGSAHLVDDRLLGRHVSERPRKPAVVVQLQDRDAAPRREVRQQAREVLQA